ncbi:hypothetical protein BDW22DRAFT_1361056 [Trametopsis cervina]|nr:hypothetical protein BDW22DRAFT_1361056 [Trametopsis cervina]
MTSADTPYGSGTVTADALLVKRHANSQLPINNLPPEVLLLIFKHYMVSKRYKHYMASKQYDSCVNFEWIRVTHVCYMWRDIALSAATLWSSLRINDWTSPERASVWLQRSQQTSLTFKALESWGFHASDERIEIYGLILAQLHRIQEFDVAVPPSELRRIQWPTTPTNALKRFNFVVRGYLKYELHEPFPFRTDVDAAFPYLESFSIKHASLQLGVCRFPSSLTDLTLWDVGPLSAASWHSITTILHGLHSLEAVTIGRSLLDETPAPTPPPVTPVSLPRLRKLQIAEHLIPCAQLLDMLAVPYGVKLSFTILVTHDTLPLLADKGKSIVSWISQVSGPWPSVAFFSWPTPDSDDDYIPSEYSFAAGEMVTLPWATETHDVFIKIEEHEQTLFYRNPQFDLFFDLFDFRPVKKLLIAMKEQQPLLRTLFQMTAVEDLCVEGTPFPEDYMHLLYPQPSTRSLLFPHLKSLYINCHRDRNGRDHHARKLRDMLPVRKKLGSPVERLVVSSMEGYNSSVYAKIRDTNVILVEGYDGPLSYFTL